MKEMTPQEIIENQKQQWNGVAPSWEKWDQKLDQNLSFLNHRLIGDAQLRFGQTVLDLGSGTGFPAVLIAQTVGEKGSVTGLDLAESMLTVAREKAQRLGVTNIQFQQGDITALPFESNQFDAVTSRFCLMFLPEIPKAIVEIARVLKPGGYLAAAVWSEPKKNQFVQIPVQALSKIIEFPKPDPNQPGIFRLAPPGELMDMAKQAGLHGIRDEEVEAESPFDSPDEYYENLLDLAAPLKPFFEKLTPDQKKQVETEVKGEIKQFQREDQIFLPMAIRLVTARKPLG
ncbi:MAG TPA: methyltransferase domain-containing protein [Nitrospiria bacterium]|jgi:ubiquinone/menaquinone biosynthesis C-methylase UbiE